MRTLPVQAVPPSFSHPLQHREPAAGFASRLAAVNGRTMAEFLREMSMANRSVDVSETGAVRQIAFLGNVAAADLARYTPFRKGEKLYTVAGETFFRKSIKRTFFSYCPCCVREDLERFEGPLAARPWLRVEWMITHVRSCPVHRTFLTEARPQRTPFSHFDFNETMRAVIPGLSGDSQGAATPASPFQDWLVGRLDGVRSEDNWLDDVDMYAAVGFCEALGVSSLHPPKVRTTKLSEADWAAAADEGYRIAASGPDSLRALLSRLNDAQSSTRGVWGPRDTYGYMYGLLQKTSADPAYGKFRDVVRAFALDTMPIEPGTDLLGVEAGERRIHTVRTAAKDSGLHALTVRRLLNRMGVAEAADGSGTMDHRIVVKADELASVVADLKEAISGPAVEKRLGVPRSHLKALVEDGHLAALAKTDRRFGKKRFSIETVEAFRARWLEGTEEVASPVGRQVDLPEVQRKHRCTLQQLLGVVLSGGLSWKGRLAGRDDYMALLVDIDEVARLLRRPGGLRANLTKEEAEASLAGTHGNAINALIEAGHLQMTEEFSAEANRVIPVISRESVDAFRDRYVALGELCQRSNLHHKQVVSHLRMAGIHPVLPQEALGAFYFERAAVELMEQERDNPWTFDKVAARRFVRKVGARTSVHLA